MLRTIVVVALLAGTVLAQQTEDTASGITAYLDARFGDVRRLSERQVAAERTLSDRNAAASAVIAAHFSRGSRLDAVQAARALLSAEPGELVAGIRVLRENQHLLSDNGTTLRPAVVALVQDLKTHIARLPREAGGHAARELLPMESFVGPVDPETIARRLASFVQTYAGTQAADEHTIQQVETDYGFDLERTRPRFRELAKRHDGTALGAQALYLLGFRLSKQAVSDSLQADPTDRFLEVLSIVRELASGRFPKCRWVDEASSLVTTFHVFEPAYAPENVVRMYEGYKSFVLSHLAASGSNPPLVELMLINGLGRLVNEGQDPLPTIERFFADLRTAGASGEPVDGMRTGFYLRILQDPSMGKFPIAPAQSADRARVSLQRLLRSSVVRVRAQALVDLAALDFYFGRYGDARNQYLSFAGSYPSSDWAWVARLRAAEAREALGDTAGASAEYEAVATRFAERTYAVALARVAAGETREAAGQFALAAANYQAAVSAWTGMPPRAMLYIKQAETARPVPRPRRFNNLAKDDLLKRVGRLAAATTSEGALLHQARLAIDEERPREAFAPLQRVVDQYRGPVAAEAALLLRRARFDAALSERHDRTVVSFNRELEALSRGQDDYVARAAKLARGAMALQSGSASQAEALTKAALEEWHARQPAPVLSADPLIKEAAAVRAVVFRPAGGGVLNHRWNAFEWPKEAAPFALVNQDLVIRTPNGQESTQSVTFSPGHGERVIFLTEDDRRMLRAILDKIGGTATREPSAVMATPNQPVGGAVAIAALWKKLFHVRPGHWGGWELTTYPHLSKIEFDREDHALASVTIGYSGATVELSKENGVWVAKRLVDIWIT